MTNILILGAGSMGTAFSFPCSDNNHDVSVIGTHLENDFIDQINFKKKHPALNCDVPKSVKFSKFEKLREEINKKVLSQVSMNRFGFVEELAWVYLTTLSPRNSFMTGSNIIIDGQQVNKII